MYSAASYIGSRLQELASLGSVVTAIIIYVFFSFSFFCLWRERGGVGVDPQVQGWSGC